MRYFKIIISFIALNITFTACQEDFLDRYPLDTITSQNFFLKSSDLQIYMNQFYSDGFLRLRRQIFYTPFSPWFGDDNNSDNSIDVIQFNPTLRGTRSVDYSGSPGWDFTNVRKINFFFDNYTRCKEPFDKYQQFVGEAHFFRALQFYYLLQAFGGVPWYNSTLETNSPELYKPRDPRNVIADNIIADLDSAAMYLSGNKDNGRSRLNKWMALLFQSEVALYEGTWEKYHAGGPFGVSNPDPVKYLNKAVEASSTLMNSGPYSIYSTGNPESDYVDLFRMRDYSDNNEIMFWKQFSSALGVESTYGGFNYLHEAPSGKSITKSLADEYLCTDGKPISVSPLFGGYNSITDEAQNRDPRFRQTIATPDDVWKIEENGTIRYYSEQYQNVNGDTRNNAGTGYLIYKGYDPRVIYHKTNYEDTPVIYARYGQVLLNYAEAKAELGTITQGDIGISIKKLRDRVGMPNLILADITMDPNWSFPDLSPVINEIRRERQIELATEGFRWQDIARWAAADELIVGKRPKGFKASQLVNSTTYPVDENGFLDPWQTALPNGFEFDIGRDYLDPVPQHQIVLNPQLVQNPGWPML